MKYLKPLHLLVGFLRAFILPYNYRSIFMGKMKVAVYLKSGQTIYVKCSKFNVKLGEDKASYSFTDNQEQLTLGPLDIVAVRVVDWWR